MNLSRRGKLPLSEEAIESVLERIKRRGVKIIWLIFADLTGRLRGLAIPAERAEDALRQGYGIDAFSVGLADIQESDAVVFPDPSTFHIIPWAPHSAIFICDVKFPGKPARDFYPRAMLRALEEEYRSKGYEFAVALETEFFCVRLQSSNKPVPFDSGEYCDLPPADRSYPIKEKLLEAFSSMGLSPYKHHHECGMGQHELTFRASYPVETGDNTLLFKFTCKLASEGDQLITFMPKPFAGIAGNGMHMHLSVFDRKGRNLFFDPEGENGLSEFGRKFIAGILEHAPALSAIVSSTVNSYKRLVPDLEAPTVICWGFGNRSALVRVPTYHVDWPEEIRRETTHLEYRQPDPACNPYLAVAAVIAAGMDGVERGMNPPEPVRENVYQIPDEELRRRGIRKIPSTLAEALDALRKNPVVCKVLGKQRDRYFSIKEKEWSEYFHLYPRWDPTYITDWEYSRYLLFA